MNNPKVSVLMPAYNASAHLREAMNSILGQKYKNFEFIIINDGSTDNTLSIIESFKDKRIKIINHKKNKGLIYSLNEGIKISKGEYIARMDSDDVSFLDRFETQVQYLEKNQDVDILGSWIRIFGKQSFIWKSPEYSELIKARMLLESCIAHPSIMMRKSFLDKHNLKYRQKYIHVEDYDLWVRAAEKGKLFNLQKVLLKYRSHDKQVSQLQNKTQIINSMKVRSNQLKKINIYPSEDQQKIHLRLALWRGAGSKKELIKINKWIEKIYFSNQKIKYFDNNFLKYILAERWVGMVLLPKKSQIKMLKYLFYIHPIFWLEIIKILFATIIQKVKLKISI